MTDPSDIAATARRLAEVSTEVADQLLREVGSCTPPTLHMLDSGFEPCYLGSCTSRSFYRGEDAARAVAELGTLASGLIVERIVVTWENADLCTALELEGESFGTAQVVLDADIDGYEVIWHPFNIELGPESATTGLPTIIPTWLEPKRSSNGELPLVMSSLLDKWKTFDPSIDVNELFDRFEREGYTLRMTEGLRRL